MSQFKNATIVALASTGTSFLFELSPLTAVGTTVASFAFTLAAPQLAEGAKALSHKAKDLFNRKRPDAEKAAATAKKTIKETLNTAIESIDQYSSVNAKSNAMLGVSGALAFTAIVGKTTGLNQHPQYPYIVAGSTAAGGFLGYFFLHQKVADALGILSNQIANVSNAIEGEPAGKRPPIKRI
ncbi:hypothetical protein [Candidatus Berkiella aquae]|uniref:Uncharacterized protein n=1 Tax=Candidatus Berkiella aquae TaxID=295108 RepID=A0A0Q9YGN7_9GAMM|nr:hypothetical protein [Candidatus Berkiella aquae]MCS5710773.1 hypothetical protein [Candidatus Berkiella aquae]